MWKVDYPDRYPNEPHECKGHWFPSGDRPVSGERCLRCGIIFCPIAYDHDDDLGYCAVCGWENEGGSYAED